MSEISFKGKGSFPLYFQHPENASAFFDLLGFSKGFKRTHPSGLSFYIHRTKNKKEMAPFGLTVPLLVNHLNHFIAAVEKTPYTQLQSVDWFGKPAVLLLLDGQKKFLILQEDHLLPESQIYQGKQSSSALHGEGIFILNSKNPEKAATWYEAFLDCETSYQDSTRAISVMTNAQEKKPGLIIIHQLEKDSKNIGPLQYKNFCLTTSNCYACWKFLKSKGKINPAWKGPQEDGLFRTVMVNGPEGYAWKIYGSLPAYSIADAAKRLKQSKEEIMKVVQKGTLPIVPEKILASLAIDPLEENKTGPYIAEDHLLQYAFGKSPYQELLTLPS